MEKKQIEYTVEYMDQNGVVYFENVKASGLSDAKRQIRQRFADVTIRAVTVVPHDQEHEQA
ncbi:hypothetical protein H7B90_28410 [Cohnella xylanilytica]|uniref:Uncharacterized protein n=1 Tax=Cohnella xylanilytica TaxID=557555 RepID=A0A841U405_9BACL|nr:hypothetical protein [Cohnella xylanilytica]MBB6695326.1 hypothetical protein [Cohnella xylanilytica]